MDASKIPYDTKSRLAILIPTIKGREEYLKRLLGILQKQIYSLWNGMCPWHYHVKLMVLRDEEGKPKKTVGEKRNILTEMAIHSGCTHRAFIDDDDTVTDDYLELNMPGVYQNYDCNSLVGIYTLNGNKDPNKHIFIHSLKYDHWYEDDKFYYRNPNHLNVCSLAKIGHVKFQDKNFGEDGCWSEDIHKGGLLKTEYEITKPFYNYLSRTKGTDGV